MPQFPAVSPTPVRMSSRQQLKDYCLRRLGAPVIEINVDDDQVEDRIQDAIEQFQEYHFDGTERLYLKALIEASVLTFATPDANLFIQGEILTGLTSGASAKMWDSPTTSTLRLKQTTGVFLDDEIVSGGTSGATVQLAATGAFVVGNWDRQYLDIAEPVLGVTRIFILGPGTAGPVQETSLT